MPSPNMLPFHFHQLIQSHSRRFQGRSSLVESFTADHLDWFEVQEPCRTSAESEDSEFSNHASQVTALPELIWRGVQMQLQCSGFSYDAVLVSLDIHNGDLLLCS